MMATKKEQQETTFLLLPSTTTRTTTRQEQTHQRWTCHCTLAQFALRVLVALLAIPTAFALVAFCALLFLVNTCTECSPGQLVGFIVLLFGCLLAMVGWRLAYDYACPTDPLGLEE